MKEVARSCGLDLESQVSVAVLATTGKAIGIMLLVFGFFVVVFVLRFSIAGTLHGGWAAPSIAVSLGEWRRYSGRWLEDSVSVLGLIRDLGLICSN